jgi:hypothetical protein
MLEGLTGVPDDALKRLLKALHHETIEAPLTPAELARNGLQSQAEPLLGHLRGLDARGVRAVVTAVLAERLHAGVLRRPGPH